MMMTITPTTPLRPLLTVAAQTPDVTLGAIAVPLDRFVDNPYQSREVYDQAELESLADSIARDGLLQIPIGRRRADGQIELDIGHRRLRAHQLLQARDPQRWRTMPVQLRQLSDEELIRHSWTENAQRSEVTAIEKAKAFQRYMAGTGWSQKQLAQQLGMDQSTVSNLLRLLKLPDVVQQQVLDRKLSERQAMALVPLAELPEAVLSRPYTYWIGGTHYPSLQAFLADAGRLSSGQLRKAVETIFESMTVNLAKEPWADETIVDDQVQATLCKECTMRLKSSHRCYMIACIERKRMLWSRQRAEAAAASVQLPALPLLAYGAYSDIRDANLDHLRAKAADKGCGHLGVMHSERYLGSVPVPDHTDCYLVCGHGPGKRCGCMQSLAASGDPTASARAKQRLERTQIQDDLLPQTKQALRQAFERPGPALWKVLLTRLGSAYRDTVSDPDAVLTALVAALVDHHVGGNPDYWGSLGTVRNRCEQLLQLAEVPIPWIESIPVDDVRANATPCKYDDLTDIAVRFGLDIEAAAVVALIGVQLCYDRQLDAYVARWPDQQLACTGDNDHVNTWLKDEAWKAWGDRLMHGTAALPAGITLIEPDSYAYETLACLLVSLTMAEHGYQRDDEVLCDEMIGDLVADLDDHTYETLTRRIHALRPQEVAV